MTSILKKRAVLAALTAANTLGAGLAQAVGVPGQGTWETTLQPRELDGNAANGPEAFYDTALDITWLNSNENLNWSWNDSMIWANTLVVSGMGGWRLPNVVDTGAPGCEYSHAGGTECGWNVLTATSELAHLWYVTLGNRAPYDTSGRPVESGTGLTNTGGFLNLQPYGYWTGTPYAPDPAFVWSFFMPTGEQYANILNFPCCSDLGVSTDNWAVAMAVRAGDVAAIPEPQTYAMLLLGLGGVLVAARRRVAGG